MKKLNQESIQGLIPKRKDDSYKGDYGRILVIGGNESMGGAIIMATSAAVNSGAGLVSVATAKTNHIALHARLPEAMVLDWNNRQALAQQVKAASVLVIGPGMGDSKDSLELLKSVLSLVTENQQIVIDGSAITMMAEHQLSTPKAKTIYTPHLGEWERLSHLKPSEQKESLNQSVRTELNATVVLKQHRTEVYFEEDVWKNQAGNPAMATGGMGDTLAGMIAGFLAQLENSKSAVLAAVYLHSHIGDNLAKKQYVVLPTHIIEQLPFTLKEFSEN